MFFGLRLIGRLIGFVFKAALFVGAIAVVAGAVACALFDGEQYKARLSKRVVDLTGRTLTIHGKAELDLSWPPRIVLNDVRLKNARWGTRPDMARIKRVEIELNPLKAISGGDSVAQVRLEGADVLVETNAQGVSNWTLGAFAAAPGAIGALGMLGSLGILGGTSSSTPPVVLSNPTVTFHDGGSGATVAVGGGGTIVEVGGGTGAGAAGGGTVVAGGGAAGAGAAGLAGSAGGLPEFAGSAGSSRVLVAAASDDNNPCDGSPRQPSQTQAKAPR